MVSFASSLREALECERWCIAIMIAAARLARECE